METAWKVAKQYFKLTGKPSKTKVISRAVAYHGTTQGALSITGVPGVQGRRSSRWCRARSGCPTPTSTGRPVFGDDEKAFGRWAADQVEEAILIEGPDTVAAVFVEPVQNAGGCFPPPPGYFERLREICDRVRRAAGLRRGDLRVRPARAPCSAAQKFGYQPDIITCAKGLTSGYSPLGAAIISDRVFEPFLRRARDLPARLHVRRPPGLLRGGPGQPGHLRARGALGNVLRNENAFRADAGEALDLPIVGDVRGDGYFYGIELVKDQATKETFDADESRAGAARLPVRRRCSRPACTAGPTTGATRWSRWPRR